jgi:hypothetical protein
MIKKYADFLGGYSTHKKEKLTLKEWLLLKEFFNTNSTKAKKLLTKERK